MLDNDAKTEVIRASFTVTGSLCQHTKMKQRVKYNLLHAVPFIETPLNSCVSDNLRFNIILLFINNFT